MSTPSLSLPPHMFDIVGHIFDAHSVVLFLPDHYRFSSDLGPEEGGADKGNAPKTAKLVAYRSAGAETVDVEAQAVAGQGLVGWILYNVQPLRAPVSQPSGKGKLLGYYREGADVGLTAFMGYPVLGGALCVDTSRPNEFSDRDVRILAMFAKDIEDMGRKAVEQGASGSVPRYFDRLKKIGDLRFACKLWSKYIEGFLRLLASSAGYEYASFSALYTGTTYCVEAEYEGTSLSARGRFYPTSSGLVGWVFKNGTPLFQSGEQQLAPGIYSQQDEAARRFRGLVCLPILVHRVVRGVVCLAHSGVVLADDALKSFLVQSANQLSIHLENLYLEAQLKAIKPPKSISGARVASDRSARTQPAPSDSKSQEQPDSQTKAPESEDAKEGGAAKS